MWPVFRVQLSSQRIEAFTPNTARAADERLVARRPGGARDEREAAGAESAYVQISARVL